MKLHRSGGSGGAGTDAHLVENMLNVGLRRPLGDKELFGNCTIRTALANEAQHLDFASGQTEWPFRAIARAFELVDIIDANGPGDDVGDRCVATLLLGRRELFGAELCFGGCDER
jgi:hypothetical protein